MIRSFLLISGFIFLAGCIAPRKTSSFAPPGVVVQGKIWTSLFQQSAAEYKALCLQAFNLARLRVDEYIGASSARLPAIITDIDETFLDNSHYSVHQAFRGMDYDQASWSEWTDKSLADTLPGALAFFQYVASKNIEIFYITNRRETEREGTLRNLKRFQFPFSDDMHLLMRQDVSSKESRRQQVESSHEIILFLGDNLADFSQHFDKKPISEREQELYRHKADFGKRFIILPNPNYGAWEEAIYNYNYNLTLSQKDSIIRKLVKGY